MTQITVFDIATGTLITRDMTPEEIAAIQPPEPGPESVPTFVTRRQAGLAMMHAGLISPVELEGMLVENKPPALFGDYIELLEQPYRAIAFADFMASEWYRDAPLIALVQGALGFSDEQVSGLFREAKKL